MANYYSFDEQMESLQKEVEDNSLSTSAEITQLMSICLWLGCAIRATYHRLGLTSEDLEEDVSDHLITAGNLPRKTKQSFSEWLRQFEGSEDLKGE